MKATFIINPISGTKSKEEIPALIQEHFDAAILYTNGPGHATELARKAAAEGAPVVVAVGGDGTVNEVAKGLVHTSTPLGIVPMGSGNGLAKHLRLPTDPEQALRRIKQNKTTAIDVIAINDEYSFNVSGIGFDAHIAHAFAKRKKRGFFSYLATFLKEYPKYEPKELKLVVDGQEVRKKALLITFANSSQFGNNITIAPKANLSDGYLDLVFLEKPPKRAVLPTALRTLAQSIHRSTYYQTIPCRTITLSEPNLLAHIDGEPRLFEDGIRITLLPLALTLIQ